MADTVPIDPALFRQARAVNAHGASQYEIARRADLSRSFVSDIEAGRRQPRMLAAKALAAAMFVTVDDLIATERPEGGS